MNDPLEVAREALEPFARAWEDHETYLGGSDDEPVTTTMIDDGGARVHIAYVKRRDLRRAREALSLLSESAVSRSQPCAEGTSSLPDTDSLTPLKRCGYCTRWMRRPCGEECAFDGRGETWEQHLAAIAKAVKP